MDWDRKYIHFCIESQQSCQEVKVACGIMLSTWAARDLPWKQSGNKYGTSPHPEKDLGYAFRVAPVNCPECVAWMEKNLGRCKGCGIVSQYIYCPKCAGERMFDVQRYQNGELVSVRSNKPLNSLEEAKDFANKLDIGNKPEALRIVDYNGKVVAWVSRNGYRPNGALAPKEKK